MIAEFIFTDAPIDSCHAPSIAETRNGMTAVWFAGKYEGHKNSSIWISRKRDPDGSWSAPVEIANGKQASGRSFPCWNPVLYFDENGALLLFYKIGKAPSSWRGMLMTSEDSGASWSNARELPRKIFGPTKNRPLLLENRTLICPSSDEEFDLWSLQFELFHQGVWRLVKGPPSRELQCIQPALLRHPNSRLQALCRTFNGALAETWSSDFGESWSELELTGLRNPNSAIDALSLRNGNHLLVFNDSKTERTPLDVAISEDGKNWDTLLRLESEAGEYSYPSIVECSDGMVHIVYTWNRKRIKHVMLTPPFSA